MINIISNSPTEEFEGVLSGGAGNYDSYNLGLVLSGPLADTVMARIAVQQNNSDGYIDSEDFDYQYPSTYGDSASNSDYDTDRYAIYGEYEYAVNSRLSLIAGTRLERFEDDYRDGNGFNSDNSDNLWNAELSARYEIDSNTMAYATVARGAKPGGVNTTATANQPIMSPVFHEFTQGKLSFDDEALLNKDIGIRTVQFDQRLSLSIALFHTDRDNAQIENWMYDDAAFLRIGYLDSNSDATRYGLALESTFAVNEQIELFANIGWLHAEVDSIKAFDLDQWAFVDKDNRDQAKSPEYQYNIGARVAFNSAWSGRFEIEGQDDSYFGYYHDGQLDGYDLLHASLNWQQGNISVTLWGRNLTDEDYAVHGLYFGVHPRDDFGPFQNETYLQLGEPRTYGVEMRYSFQARRLAALQRALPQCKTLAAHVWSFLSHDR